MSSATFPVSRTITLSSRSTESPGSTKTSSTVTSLLPQLPQDSQHSGNFGRRTSTILHMAWRRLGVSSQHFVSSQFEEQGEASLQRVPGHKSSPRKIKRLLREPGVSVVRFLDLKRPQLFFDEGALDDVVARRADVR